MHRLILSLEKRKKGRKESVNGVSNQKSTYSLACIELVALATSSSTELFKAKLAGQFLFHLVIEKKECQSRKCTASRQRFLLSFPLPIHPLSLPFNTFSVSEKEEEEELHYM